MLAWLRRLLTIEPGISLAQWTYDRISNNWDRIAAFFIAMGGMSYLASITNWVAAWGPFGIGAAGLVAGIVMWLAMELASLLRAQTKARQANVAALEKWKEQVDTVNPLLPEFHTKRLRVSDLAHPIGNSIENKRLIDCELVGPANLMLFNVDLNGVAFINCDIIAVKVRTPVNNAVGLKSVKMIGGSIWNCTLLIPLHEVKKFSNMGAVFLSLTGSSEIDNPQPPSTA